MTTLVSHSDLNKQRKEQARVLSKEARGEHLNLGKKIKMPKDLQIEELNLQSNRGSRMFLERQRRAEKFTLENPTDVPGIHSDLNQTQDSCGTLGGKENVRTQVVSQQPGKHIVASHLTKPAAKKGGPGYLVPGYPGLLKEIPREKFNVTVIPKSYCSPWREALDNNEELLGTNQLLNPPQQLQPANFRCFNRAPVPFGGPARTKVVPIQSLERLQTKLEPNPTWDRMTRRPNFNRAPRGWGKHYSPESHNL